MNKIYMNIVLLSLVLFTTIGCSNEEVIKESSTMKESYEVFIANLESEEYTIEMTYENDDAVVYNMYVLGEGEYAIYLENKDGIHYSLCNINGESLVRKNGEVTEEAAVCLDDTPGYFSELYDEINGNIERYEDSIVEEDSSFVLKSDGGLEISISKDSKYLEVIGADEFDKFSVTIGKVTLPY